MATITAVNLDHVNDAFSTTFQSPIDIANNIKSYASSNGDTLDTTKMLVSALGTLETFASAASKYETAIPGATLSCASLVINIKKAINDLSISYEMIDGQKEINNIKIHSDNVSLEDIANLTSYTKEDLQTFNLLDKKRKVA